MLVILTHHFNDMVVETLERLNESAKDRYDVLVLFDKAKYEPHETVERLRNIRVKPTERVRTSYDHGGHSMYIHHFRAFRSEIEKYDHIWVFENDVYYPGSLTEFSDLYETDDHDLLVPEYGLRCPSWLWTKSLKGFRSVRNVGVLAVAMRLSPRLLARLVDTIDLRVFGYLEAVLPHICLENGFSIQQFMPETCGIVTRSPDPLLELIVLDIRNGTRKYLRKKIYHPVKNY